MKKEATTLRKTRAKSPVKPTLKADNNFWSGLVIVISGILALLIFLSLFLRFMIGLALYDEAESQSALSVEGNRLETESKEIEKSLNRMKFSDSGDLISDAIVDSVEFMELPEGKDNLSDLNFVNSPDGSKFAYAVKNEEGKYAVMLNDAVSPYYDEVSFMIFSPDSQHFAYGAELDGKRFVVIDGKQGRDYSWLLLPRFFTPDSKYFVYKVRVEAGDKFVFNEDEQELYDQLYSPFISSDKNEMIYYARRGNKIYKNSLALEKYED